MSFFSSFLALYRMPEDIRTLLELTMSLTTITADLAAKVADLETAVQTSNDKADLVIAALDDVRAQLEAALVEPAQAEAAIQGVLARIDTTLAAVREQTAQNEGALEPEVGPADPVGG